jgi:hypothetical protein
MVVAFRISDYLDKSQLVYMLFSISRIPLPRCFSSIDDDRDAVDTDERACKANMSA